MKHFKRTIHSLNPSHCFCPCQVQARITVSYKPSATEREELHGSWTSVSVPSSSATSNHNQQHNAHTHPTGSAMSARSGLQLLADVTEKTEPSRVICHPIELARLHAVPDSRVLVHPGALSRGSCRNTSNITLAVIITHSRIKRNQSILFLTEL